MWKTAWDTPEDAAQFADVARGVVAALRGRGEVVATSGGNDVRILLANDDATLDLLRGLPAT